MTLRVECLCRMWSFIRRKYLLYWKKSVQHIELFKIEGNKKLLWYNVKFTSPKDLLHLKKKMVKFLVKIPRHFDIALLIWSICLFFITYENWLIAYKNYLKFCMRKCKNSIMCIEIMTHQWFIFIPRCHCWG